MSSKFCSLLKTFNIQLSKVKFNSKFNQERDVCTYVLQKIINLLLIGASLNTLDFYIYMNRILRFQGCQEIGKAKLLQLKLLQIFARDIFLMKKLEIEKTKPTFIISVLKVEYQVVLVSSISNSFIDKMSLANNWRRKKIPNSVNSALLMFLHT